MRKQTLAATAAIVVGLVMTGTGAYAAPDPSSSSTTDQSSKATQTPETPSTARPSMKGQATRADAASTCPQGALCVDASGTVPGSYQTIQDAIAQAATTGVMKIVVFAGDYAPVTVPSTLPGLQIEAAQGANVTVSTVADASDTAAISVQANGVELTGIQTICKPTTGYSRGVDLSGVNAITIKGLTTTNCQRGISLSQATDVSITGSTFTGYQNGVNSAAIWGDNVQNLVVADSSFSDQNTGTNFSGYNHLTIQKNAFADMGTASVFANGEDGRFLDNKVTKTTGSGVYVTGTKGFTGSGNTLSDGASYGFFFGTDWGADSGDITITNNAFTNVMNWAVNFDAKALVANTDATVTGNSFANSPKTINAAEAGAAVIIPTPKITESAPVCKAGGSEPTGSYTLPASAGTTYTSNGVAARPGTYPVSTKDVAVQATADQGLRYASGQTVIKVTVAGSTKECSSNSPKPVPSSHSATSTPSAPASTTKGDTSLPLANTGAEGTVTISVLALLLVLAGGGAVFIARRRRAHR